jgi:hypothetical protein
MSQEEKLMNTRTVVCLTVVFVGYGVFLHAAKARGQASQSGKPIDLAVAVPAFPALPAIPAHFVTPALPAMLAMPHVPAVPPIPAIPAIPSVPPMPSLGDWGGTISGGWSSHGDGPAADCSALHIRLHDERPTIEPEERSVSKSEAHVLRVHPLKNGGAQVQGWEKDTYSITACKAAVGSDARQLLSQIKLTVKDGEVSVSGPSSEDNDWTVFLLIRTPKAADVEVTTHNGPVSFYGVDGKLNARATNGPISVEGFSGEADISAENGPISFEGNAGKLRLHTQNGPINVSVGGSSWTGGGLVAEAENGPLTLHVPSGFQSAFLVESSDHAPLSCHASICSETRRTWDDDHRRIEFGSGSPLIRLSTHNGPISVQ